jgi:CDP-paratose 2-epimerase
MKILVTGSSGLIGGEAVEYFDRQGHEVIGFDNNMRAEFFGPAGDTLWNLNRIAHKAKRFEHHPVDVRDYLELEHWFIRRAPFDAVIHCAAQPSHDKAKEIPTVDFAVNATGTLNMLELTRKYSPNATFIFMSTNKVYGDAPNKYPMVELPTRYAFSDPQDKDGVNETCTIDRSTHSVFGASKLAADVMVQEYAKTYGMHTCVFRGGCLTGPGHSGVELHGFLSYLVKTAVAGKKYRVYGYKGKQVRDNIHSDDVVRAFDAVITGFRNHIPGNVLYNGQVYNLGGGNENSVSMIEAIAMIDRKLGKKLDWEYVPENRLGDHICYITDMDKFRSHFPNWSITKSLDQILDEIIQQCYWDGFCDCEETRTYPLNADSVVMDVGGYKGDWTASIVEKYNSNVWVFEPVKEFYDVCVERFKENPKVHVHRLALSDVTSNVNSIRKQGMNSSSYREHMPADAVYGDPVDERVQEMDITAFMTAMELRHVDLLSMNCEGGEFPLLNRLLNTNNITRFDNIQIQFHSFYPNASRERDEIRDDLRDTHTESYAYPFVWESWKLTRTGV